MALHIPFHPSLPQPSLFRSLACRSDKRTNAPPFPTCSTLLPRYPSTTHCTKPGRAQLGLQLTPTPLFCHLPHCTLPMHECAAEPARTHTGTFHLPSLPGSPHSSHYLKPPQAFRKSKYSSTKTRVDVRARAIGSKCAAQTQTRLSNHLFMRSGTARGPLPELPRRPLLPSSAASKARHNP